MKKPKKYDYNFYNKNLQKYANARRKNMTKSEACLWKYVLKNRQMKGYQFRRQRPALKYIADFMCQPLNLIIEVDGISHLDEKAFEKDKKREAALEAAGFKILRFSDWEVLNRIGQVALEIEEWIEKNAVCPPPKPRQRGKSRLLNNSED